MLKLQVVLCHPQFFFVCFKINFPYLYNLREIVHDLGGRSKPPGDAYCFFWKGRPKPEKVTEGMGGGGRGLELPFPLQRR